MEICYEDESVIVVRKPAGIESQSGRTFAPDMVSLLKKELFLRTGKPNPYVAVIHRLDRNVEGIMVYGKTAQAASNLSRQVQNHEIQKQYQALLTGRLPEHSGTLTDWLWVDKKNNLTTVVCGDYLGAQKAVLHYALHPLGETDLFWSFPLGEEERRTLWVADIDLITGRHHQIRVQFANAGAPLWGDCKYNPAFAGRRDISRIGLCACALTFRHPVTGRTMRFTLETPCKKTGNK